MSVLVVGASGATGRLLVEQLLDRGVSVRIIVRPQCALPENFTNRENLTTIRATILELSDTEMAQHVKGCDAVASCLGHNMSLKGIYAHPRRLVTDATRRLCNAIKANKSEKPARFVLMNTAGNSNRDLHEPISFAQRCVVGLVRLLLPPQMDNEKAADLLRVESCHAERSEESCHLLASKTLRSGWAGVYPCARFVRSRCSLADRNAWYHAFNLFGIAWCVEYSDAHLHAVR